MPEGNYTSREERMGAYHQKFVAALSRDRRVLLIKLADRLRNLFTCHSLSREAQVCMVKETEDAYLLLVYAHTAPSKDLLLVLAEIKVRLQRV